MKAAVIGIADPVGSRLVESFCLDDGPSLVAIATEPLDFVRAGRFAVDLRPADLLRVESLQRAFKGCGAVVYIVRPEQPEPVRAAGALCRGAAAAGVRRLVLVSTADVHGPAPREGTNEETPLPAKQPFAFAQTCAQMEREFLGQCQQLFLAGFVLRPPPVYGPRARWFDHLASNLATGRGAPVGKEEGICNAVYVDHVVAAIRLCLRAKSGAGTAYLVGDGDTYTWRDLYLAVAGELRSPPGNASFPPAWGGFADPAGPEGALSLQRDSDPPMADLKLRHRCRWKLPNERATRDLGYQPSLPLHEAVRRSCGWWRFAHGSPPATS